MRLSNSMCFMSKRVTVLLRQLPQGGYGFSRPLLPPFGGSFGSFASYSSDGNNPPNSSTHAVDDAEKRSDSNSKRCIDEVNQAKQEQDVQMRNKGEEERTMETKIREKMHETSSESTSAHAWVTKNYVASRHGEHAEPATITQQEMTVPSKLVGAIIGTRGAHIQRARCESGARICVRDDPGGDAASGDSQVVIVTGTEVQVETAKQLIDGFMSRGSATEAARSSTRTRYGALKRFARPRTSAWPLGESLASFASQLSDGDDPPNSSADAVDDADERRLGLFHFYKAVGILGVTEMRVKLNEYAIRQRVEAEEMKVMASESKTGVYHLVSLRRDFISGGDEVRQMLSARSPNCPPSTTEYNEKERGMRRTRSDGDFRDQLAGRQNLQSSSFTSASKYERTLSGLDAKRGIEEGNDINQQQDVQMSNKDEEECKIGTKDENVHETDSGLVNADVATDTKKNAEDAATTTKVLTIPSVLVDVLIGKGSERADWLATNSGARISVADGTSPDNCIVTIAGTENQVETAKRLIFEYLSSTRGRKFVVGRR